MSSTSSSSLRRMHSCRDGPECAGRRAIQRAPSWVQWVRRRIAARLRAAGDGEAGYNIVEFMLTFVALIVITMILIQFALLWHARHVAQAAAQDALRTASDYQSSAAAGQTDAYSYLQQVAPHLVLNPHVAVTRTATTVTVEVSGGVLSVGPFHLTVRESASGPVERRSP